MFSFLFRLRWWSNGVPLGNGVVDRFGLLRSGVFCAVVVVSSFWRVLSLLFCLPQFGSKAGLKASWNLRVSGHVSGFAWFVLCVP